MADRRQRFERQVAAIVRVLRESATERRPGSEVARRRAQEGSQRARGVKPPMRGATPTS